MKTFLSLPYEKSDSIPDSVDEGDDVRMPEPLVEHVVETFTDPGETVLDPFAGFGTTLAVAAELDRVPHGVEFEADRAAFVRERVGHDENVVHGDVFDLDWSRFPDVDLCLTSPPYIAWETGIDPLRNYDPESQTTYEAYLDDLAVAFDRVSQCMTPDSTLVVEVANLKNDAGVFPLAWDVGTRLAERFAFRGETVVTWEGTAPEDGTGVYGYGYDHSYCLVYDVDGTE